MKEQQTVIFLVRHSETDFAYVNDPKIDDNRRLTKYGKEQSKKNGEYLWAFAPAAILSSPLHRTIETSEIIKKHAEIPRKIIEEKDLYEIYSNASWQSIGTRLPKLFEEIVKKYSGKHVVCVTHLDVIEGSLTALGLTHDEREGMCQMGQMYRLVFADEKFVQATKLNPSKSK